MDEHFFCEGFTTTFLSANGEFGVTVLFPVLDNAKHYSVMSHERPRHRSPTRLAQTFDLHPQLGHLRGQQLNLPGQIGQGQLVRRRGLRLDLLTID